MLKTAIEKFSSQISERPGFDGRYLLILVLTLYFSIVFFSGNLFDTHYTSVWQCLAVPATKPPFIDVVMMTSALDCYHEGVSASEIIVGNPCDPLGRPLNNPRLWLTLLAPTGIGSAETLTIGILQDIIFFLAVFIFIRRLNNAEAAIYGLMLCSPSIMFLVERGNNDIVLFTFIVGLVFLSAKNSALFNIIRGLTILFSAMLKFYPIFALPVIMKERPKTLLLTAAGTISAFLAYCFFIRDDMINIFMVTPREYLFSYGAFTYMDGLMKNLYPELAETALPIVHKILLAIASLLTGCCFVLAARNPLPENTDTAHIDAFRMGSGIYAGTFFLGNNLEYRLVFLLLTMPQLLAWAKYRSRPSAMASAAIALIIIRCWASVWGDIIPLFRVTYLVKNLTEWAVFAILIYMSVQTLPLWIKERLSFRTS